MRVISPLKEPWFLYAGWTVLWYCHVGTHIWPAQESPGRRPGSGLVGDILEICFVSLGDKLLRGLLGKFVLDWHHMSQVLGIRKVGLDWFVSWTRPCLHGATWAAAIAPPRRWGPGPRPATCFKYNLRINPSTNLLFPSTRDRYFYEIHKRKCICSTCQ